QRTTRADREWRSNQLLYIDVFPELSRESAILARVSGRAIGPCHHKVLPHEILNVALGHIKGCKAGVALTLDDFKRGLNRRLLPFAGDLRKRLTHECVVARAGDQQ